MTLTVDSEKIISVHRDSDEIANIYYENQLVYTKYPVIDLTDSAVWSQNATGDVGYFGSSGSVVSTYQGSWNLTATLTKAQPAGLWTLKFYRDKQYNFRMSPINFTFTYEDGTTETLYSTSENHGGDVHGWVEVDITIPKNWKALNNYVNSWRANTTYCFGGTGKICLIFKSRISNNE